MIRNGSSSAKPCTFETERLHERVPVQGEIEFVGLGHMGTPMATNLAAAGYRVKPQEAGHAGHGHH